MKSLNKKVRKKRGRQEFLTPHPLLEDAHHQIPDEYDHAQGGQKASQAAAAAIRTRGRRGAHRRAMEPTATARGRRRAAKAATGATEPSGPAETAEAAAPGTAKAAGTTRGTPSGAAAARAAKAAATTAVLDRSWHKKHLFS